jgi:signal transduction histidine kinase
MSLHAKVVAWFVLFATMLLGLFMLGDYYQATRTLQIALESRAVAVASELALDIERRQQLAERDLLGLGHAVLLRTPRSHLPVPAGFTRIRVRSGGRVIWESAGAPAVAPAEACASGDAAFSVDFNDARGRPHTIEASMPAAQLLSGLSASTARLGNNGITAVVATDDGGLVLDQGCLLRDAADAAVPEAITRQVTRTDAAARTYTVVLGDFGASDLRLAVARAAQPAWSAAVAVDYNEFAAAFVRVQRQYFAVMVGIVVVMLLVVLSMIRRDMHRLHSIAAAADAIGRGRFDVWLPPPTDDEVGRLSLALGRMVNRLSSTLHQMEITRAMAAVGELASYLSHEVRNPLSSIRLNLQMLRRDLAQGVAPDDGDEIVELCLSELQRLDDVVKTVLDVGRPGSAHVGGTCDVHAVVENALHVLEPKLAASGVTTDARLGAPESDVALDATQFKGVLINLVLNSVDALAHTPDAHITITTELQEIEHGQAMLELHVADNGPGVPPHLRERIFEPFFTTKPSGNGIGLATALRVVQQCGGVMRCTPQAERPIGAEFVLELPVVRALSARTEEPVVATAAPGQVQR